MEANTPYALYDNDGSQSMQWAAHIRLTPELLHKLQCAPEEVLLTLNASNAARPGAKKTSLLSVDMGSHAEADDDPDDVDVDNGSSIARYELHSFREDPRVNYLCAFRRDTMVAPADATALPHGHSIYTIGSIYQKLIVQRQLDSTEKGRMKDRHAQSVRDSRARTSKRLDDDDAIGNKPPLVTKRRRVIVSAAASTLTRRSQTTSRVASAASNAAPVDAAPQRQLLRSALSVSDAQQARERIERGFPPPAPVVKTKASVATEEARPTAADVAALFSSSESDASDHEDKQPDTNSAVRANDSPATTPATNTVAPPSPLQSTPATSSSSSVVSTNTVALPAPTLAPLARLPAVRNPAGAVVETKRPMPRGAVRKQQRIDLSAFPPDVATICNKIATHIPRTTVLDDADYDMFTHQYMSFSDDWTTLDKAYSIAVINMESVHVRMALVTSDEERAALTREREANDSKRESLLFVRDAMASVKKILASLQTSIARFDEKLNESKL